MTIAGRKHQRPAPASHYTARSADLQHVFSFASSRGLRPEIPFAHSTLWCNPASYLHGEALCQTAPCA